ncbi:MAG TPA: hypothetical protein VMS65_13070 [Polyangiaceae bacterium]|nr:hypothetical protein [Polyangiaceae bacterium]
MRPGRALLFAVAAFIAVCLASRAHAQDVVLVRPPAGDEVLTEAFNRLRAELAIQGFRASVVPLDADADSPAELAALAQKAGAFAGISLTRRVGTSVAEICIADRVTGKVSLRTVALGNEPEAPNVLAVRTADLLRASLREFKPNERPPPEVAGVDEKPPPEAVERFTRAPPKPFRLDARIAVLGLTQSEGRSIGPALALGYRLSDPIGVGVFLAGPTLASTIQSDFGSATVHHVLGLARVWVNAYESDVFELRPVLAAGIYYLDARGDVEPPLISQSAQITSFAGGGGLEAALRLTSTLVVGAELSAFALNPRPVVAVHSDEYEFPLPFVSASLGVGVEF